MIKPIQITPSFKEDDNYKKILEQFQINFIKEVKNDIGSHFNEAVFQGGRQQLQPLVDIFQQIKDILEASIKKDGSNFNPTNFWKDPSFLEFERIVINIFGFRDADVEPLRESYNKGSDCFTTKKFNCFTYTNEETRFPIDALVTDKGFYDKSHTIRATVIFTLGIIRICTAEELSAIFIHEIGHNIDPALVDIRYTETNILSKYLTDRVGAITSTEKMTMNKLKKGLLGKLVVSGIILTILGIISFIKFVKKIFFNQEEALEKIRQIIRDDPDQFTRQSNEEAFADNFARMYGMGGALISGFQKVRNYGDIERGRIKKEKDRQRMIADITRDMISDVHKTDIHRIYSLIKEYKVDLQDPNIPNLVKTQLRNDLKEVETVLDWHLNKRGEFQNRINRIIYDELSKIDATNQTSDKPSIEESILTEKKDEKYTITTKEREEFKSLYPAAQCILKKDKDGYYLGGGRSRSDSRNTIKGFTTKEIEFYSNTM